MINPIRVDARARGITRLCHFTPSRNLPHILESGVILPTQSLKEDVRAVFNPTDLQRLDGYEDHVCCSVQYPNGWYFAQKRNDEPVFVDWVILLIDPGHLWQEGTLFCYRNAAAERGQLVDAGFDSYEGMFAHRVVGAMGRTYERSRSHLASCPTDNQAEVLVPNGIPWKHVLGIVFSDETQAQREVARLALLGQSLGSLRLIVSPDMYNKRRLSRSISEGRPIEETLWEVSS